MSLSDAVAGSGLELYPKIALVLFFLVFAGITLYVVLRRRGAWDQIARLPLSEPDELDELAENSQNPAVENGQ